MLDEPRKLAPAAKQNLTTLHVLVQNRRKDSVPVLLFGGRAQVVTKPSGTKDALRGRMMGTDSDDVTTFTRNGSVLQVRSDVQSFAKLKGCFLKQKACCDRRRQRSLEQRAPGAGSRHKRRCSTSTCACCRQNHEPNASIQVDLPPYPSVLEDASQAIVALSRGDYAVMSLQFRTGDGKNVNRDWQAFRLLDHVVIPFMAWDSNARATTIASTLPPAYTLPNARTQSSTVKHLHLRFDQGAVTRFYKDAIARGDSEFLRTHHGDVSATMHRSMNNATMVLTEATLRLAEVPEAQRSPDWRDSMKNSIVGLL